MALRQKPRRSIRKAEIMSKSMMRKTGNTIIWKNSFYSIPGIADGTVSDLDLLAAVCDAEAGDQGLIGMEAVALCILNSTIDTSKGFPSEIRYVVYQGKPTQYAVVTDGSLLKRLNGHFSDRTMPMRRLKQP